MPIEINVIAIMVGNRKNKMKLSSQINPYSSKSIYTDFLGVTPEMTISMLMYFELIRLADRWFF
ncbi:hypothetical protein Musp01_16110 [Muricauda sp. NBRC 101325]|nr:hypothetical protein Musp01_16110 [Muricauda sp. NBRC 101325]